MEGSEEKHKRSRKIFFDLNQHLPGSLFGELLPSTGTTRPEPDGFCWAIRRLRIGKMGPVGKKGL
jgi:hypothetical protein